MSGEESLAQVYREIEQPKVKNLQRAGHGDLHLQPGVHRAGQLLRRRRSFPTRCGRSFYDNLISGLAMHLVGPLSLRLLFQAFVVVVGFLMLAGAVNTAIVGSNGVLNRVSEDGVLTDWFRKPHRRFGTTYRLINLIVAPAAGHDPAQPRQRLSCSARRTRSASIWSFAFNALAVLVLRYKRPDAPRRWRVPLNSADRRPRTAARAASDRVGRCSPCAVVNLFTKEIATIAGIAVHRRVLRRCSSCRSGSPRASAQPAPGMLDQFQLIPEPDIGARGARMPAGRRAGAGSRLQHAVAARLGPRPHGRREPRRRRADDPAAAGPDGTARQRHRATTSCSPTTSRRCSRGSSRSPSATGRSVKLLVVPGHQHLRRARAVGGASASAARSSSASRPMMTPDDQAHADGRGVGSDAARTRRCTRFVVLLRTGR